MLTILGTGCEVQALAFEGKRLKPRIFLLLFLVEFVRLLFHHLVDFVRYCHPRYPAHVPFSHHLAIPYICCSVTSSQPTRCLSSECYSGVESTTF
jgi:hypothetical protein